jgi:hypothetical protein
MKNINLVLITGLLLIFAVSCKKEKTKATLPILTTVAVTDILDVSAKSGGQISNDGGASITAKGVVWGTSPSPTISLSTKTNDGSGNSAFVSEIISLAKNTTYYVRAYATNSAGTAYGNEISFSTLNVDLTNGLAGYYPFSGNANDSSGNNVHGVVTGAQLTTDRKGTTNCAYSFNGTNQYITIPDNNAVNDFTTQLSISIWINYNGFPGTNTSSQVIGKWGIGGMDNAAYGIGMFTQNSTTAILRGTIHKAGVNSDVSTSPSTISINTWNHLVYTFKEGVHKIYLNGELIKSATGPISSTQNSRYNIDIGREAYGNYVYYKGVLDDVYLYNRELNIAEVKGLYRK